MPDPFEKTIERMLDGDATSRAVTSSAPLGASALAVSSAGTLLAACGGTEGTDKGDDASKPVTVNHPKTAIDRAEVLELAALHRQEDDQGLRQEVRRQDQVRRGHQRQRRVQRQGAGAAAPRPLDRPRHRRPDRLDGRALDPRRSGSSRSTRRTSRTSRTSSRRSRRPSSTPSASTRCRGRRGMTAIGYNPKKTGRKLGSIKDLFDPKFKGRVTMLQEWRDSAGLVLLGQGKDPATATLDDVMARDREDRGGGRQGPDPATSPATTTRAASRAATCGSSSPTRATSSSSRPTTPSLEFLIPEEGAMLWTDNMLMPQKPPHPYAAETMMNYVYDPVVAAQIAAYVNYVTPVKGAKEELAKTDPETAEQPADLPERRDAARSSSRTRRCRSRRSVRRPRRCSR